MQPAAPLPALVPARARPLRLAGLAALAVTLLLPTPPALATGAIPPGLEAEVSRLLLPDADTPALPGGYRVGNVTIGATELQVQLLGRDDEGELFLVPGPEAAAEAALVTPSFQAQLPEGAPPEFLAAAHALLERVRERDDGSFGRRVGTLRRAQQEDPEAAVTALPIREPPIPLPLSVDLLAVLALLLLGADLLGTLRRRRKLLPVVAGAAGLFVVALVLRLWLSPASPLHADRHGMLELGGLAGLWPGEGALAADLYGPAYRRLLAPLAALFQSASWPLVAGGLAGALGAPAILLLGRKLSGSWLPGVVAAIGLAVHPGHIRLSVSESPWPLALTLFALGTWCWARALGDEVDGRARWVRLIAGLALLGLAVQLRVVTLGLGPLAIALAAVPHLPTWKRSLPRLLAPALGLAAICGAHLWSLQGHLEEGLRRGDDPGLSTITQLLDETSALASPALLALAALGLLALVLRKRLLLAALLLLTPIGLSAASWQVALTCRTDLIRYQSATHFFLLLAVGMGVLLAPRARQRALSVLLALGVVLASLPGLPFTSPPDLHDLAYLGVRDSAEHLPSRIQVLSLPRWSAGRRIQEVFPSYLLESRGITVGTGAREESSDACFVYLGPGCYCFIDEELEAGTIATIDGEPARPECAALPFVLPSSDGPLARRVEVPWPELDFHRILARRPWIGLLPCRPLPTDSGVEGVELDGVGPAGEGLGADLP